MYTNICLNLSRPPVCFKQFNCWKLNLFQFPVYFGLKCSFKLFSISMAITFLLSSVPHIYRICKFRNKRFYRENSFVLFSSIIDNEDVEFMPFAWRLTLSTHYNYVSDLNYVYMTYCMYRVSQENRDFCSGLVLGGKMASNKKIEEFHLL